MNHNPQTINMCSHGMFCGAGSIKRMAEDDDNRGDDQPCKTLSRALSASSGSKKKAGKNPYSGRGLDKFSSVLSELEARREKIMASAGPQSVALVRFMHSNSHDWVPIVVRQLRDSPTKENQHPANTKMRLAAADSQPPARRQPEAPKEARGATAAQKAVKKSFSWGSDDNGKRRGYSWVVVMVIILVCLMVFGRVFAICCTSIWWYLVPTLKGEEEQNRRSMKKKDYGRRMISAKGINSSSNNNNNNNALTSPKSAHATHGKRGN